MFISNKYISVCIFVCDVMSSISNTYITLVIKIIIYIGSYVNRIYFQKIIRHHAVFLTNNINNYFNYQRNVGIGNRRHDITYKNTYRYIFVWNKHQTNIYLINQIRLFVDLSSLFCFHLRCSGLKCISLFRVELNDSLYNLKWIVACGCWSWYKRYYNLYREGRVLN
jgi:hypothetical protein